MNSKVLRFPRLDLEIERCAVRSFAIVSGWYELKAGGETQSMQTQQLFVVTVADDDLEHRMVWEGERLPAELHHFITDELDTLIDTYACSRDQAARVRGLITGI